MAVPSYDWTSRGNVNAFFGLMLDDIANPLLMVGSLPTRFGYPATFALRYMVPGTALGMRVGEMLFTCLALGAARRSGRDVATSMPLGLHKPNYAQHHRHRVIRNGAGILGR